MADIYLCEHCGEKMTTKRRYCKFCTTADMRKQQDEDNKLIKQQHELSS